MAKQYYDRYQEFRFNNQIKMLPFIKIGVRETDIIIEYKSNKTRLDQEKELEESIQTLAAGNKDVENKLRAQAAQIKQNIEAEKNQAEATKIQTDRVKKFNDVLEHNGSKGRWFTDAELELAEMNIAVCIEDDMS